MILRACYLLALIVGVNCTTGTVFGATHDFYKGKTIRLLVGASPGGAFDTYARTIGRHLGKYIPGSPAIAVENMTGAAV